MIAAIADPAFWYGLALKIAITASMVVVASVVGALGAVHLA
jgi:ABC-type proline/glycine betaine transport system permease subunit